MTEKENYIEQAEELAGRMADANSTQAVEIAQELSGLGIWQRGSINPRGRLWQAAKSALSKGKLAIVRGKLDDSDSEVRCQMASALGQWGGLVEANALLSRLRSDGSIEDKHCYLYALKNIGGLLASRGLAWALKQTEDDEDDFLAIHAISYIDDLITGGPVEVTEGVDREYGRREMAGYRETLTVRLVEETLWSLKGRRAISARWTLELFD